jgi:putative flippase GtrA
MRIVKFSLVGTMGILVQLAILSLLSRYTTNYLLASGLAVESAVLHNFCWHQRFTWADRNTSGWFFLMARFHATNAAISLVGNLAFMWLLVGSLRLSVIVASAMSISICAFVNYFVSDRWVFVPKSDGGAGVTPAPIVRASTPRYAQQTGHK